ncbi:MAG: hypothetical protein ACMXYM_04100 [Candidatus Woesearchaeota archaeon]
MVFSWITWGATLIIGPLVFFVYSRVLHRNRRTHQWPVGLVDSVGDVGLLPVFNGFAVGLGLAFSEWRLAVALIVATISAAFFYRFSVSSIPNWSKNDDSSMNPGGWYHFVFLYAQVGLAAYALLTHPTSVLLWSTIGLFLFTLFYYWFVQLPKRAPIPT